MHKKLAVIGLACNYPGAKTPLELWENILAKRQQFRKMPDERLPLSEYHDPNKSAPDKTYSKQAAVIDGFNFDWQSHRIPKSTVESTDIVHWLALETALAAVKDAGYTSETLPNGRMGAIVGNTLTGEFTRASTMRLRWPYVKKVLLGVTNKRNYSPEEQDALLQEMEIAYKSVIPNVDEDTLAGGLSNTIAGRICNYLNLHGGGYTVDGACASSILAVNVGATYLANGDMDMVLVGGVDVSLDPFEIVGFSKTGALTDGEMRVYDSRGNGFIPGEGCGFAVLKGLEEAKKDGDYIYAVLDGWGIASDGKGGITAPSAGGQSQALKNAYQKAGINPHSLDFIEGHGTGTKVGDRTELMGIIKTVNEAKPAKDKSIGMTSFKSIVGHTKAAAGIGAFIKTVIATNQRTLPPTSGCEIPHDIFKNEGKSLYPIISGQTKDSKAKLRAGVSAMGFGGINSHVTLESGDAPSKKLSPKLKIEKILASPQDSEVFFISENTPEELMSKLSELAEDAEAISIAELTDLAAHLAETHNPSAQYRVALVANSPDELHLKLKESLEKEAQKKPVKPPKISFLFPGQGSQMINMSRALIDRYDWAKTTLKKMPEIESVFIKSLEKISSDQETEEWTKELKETKNAQPAIIMASLLWSKFLKNCAITPNQVAGHSLGELLAFHLTDAMSEKELLELAKLRGTLMHNSKGGGTMMSLACNESQAQALIEESRTKLVIANINSPTQTIVSGDIKEIETLSAIAEAKEILTIKLNVSNAFHSEFVKKSAQELKEKTSLKGRFKNDSGIKLISTKTASELKEIELEIHFSEQITAPVKFIEAIKTMEKNTDIFIEVGPRSVLTSLVRQISESEGLDIKVYPTESQAQSMRDINSLLARLFESGYPLNTEPLYKDRLTRPYVRPKDLAFIRNPLEKEILSAEDLSIKAIPKPKEATIGTLEDLGFEPSEQLQAYFQGRKEFLRDMIAADIKNSSNFTPIETNLIEATQAPTATIAAAISPPTEISTSLPSSSLSETIYALVEEKTGFSKESLTMDLRLLDDLNMDSIKAGEFIGNLSEKCGVPGKIDPTNHANATLAEIALIIEQLEEKSGGSKSSAQETYFEEKDPGWVRKFIRSPQAILDISNLEKATESETLFITNSKALYKLSRPIVSPKEINPNDLKSNIILAVESTGGTKSDIKMLHMMAKLASSPRVTQLTIIEDTKGSFIPAAAFFASIHLESPNLKIRSLTIEWPKTKKAKMLKVLNELLDTLPNDSHQSLFLNKDAELQKIEAKLHHSKSKKQKLGKQDIILVTGGAKGITAECALELAKKYKSKMALVGSSPVPRPEESSEIHRTLDAYRSESLSAEYYSCNVSDTKSVEGVIKEIEEKQGKVTVLIHGAGINKPKRADQVELEDAIGECLPKVEGIKNLLEVLKDDELKLLVGFSSIIGVTGMPGNAWYAHSNQSLTGQLKAHKASHPETQVISMAYSVWDEVGMGAKLGSTESLKKLGIFAIPKDEGVSAFMELIDSETDNEEVIITAALGGLDTWHYSEYIKPEASRFLHNIERYTRDVYLRATPIISHEDDYYLKDHNFEGSYLFPTVFGLEAMAQAVAYLTGRQGFEELVIKDIKLDRPISVPENAQEPIIIEAKVETYKNALPDKVHVTIRPKKTSIPDPYFSADFHLQESPAPANAQIKLPETPTQINPQTDLYGPILFQGPLFQRMGTVHELTEKTNLFEILPTDPSTLIQKTYSQKAGTPFILGDPYARDTLLQSVQASIPKDLSLPVSIEKYDLINPSQPITNCNLSVKEKTSSYHLNKVQSFTPTGTTKETLTNYKTKILRYLDANPSVSQILDIENQIERILETKLNYHANYYGYQVPKIAVFNNKYAQFDKDEMINCVYEKFPEIRGRLQEINLVEISNDQFYFINNYNAVYYASFSNKNNYSICSLAKFPHFIEFNILFEKKVEENIYLDTHLSTHINISEDKLLRKLKERSIDKDSLIKNINKKNMRLSTFKNQDLCKKIMTITEDFGGGVIILSVNLNSLEKSSNSLVLYRDDEFFHRTELGPQGQELFRIKDKVLFKEVNSKSRNLSINTIANWMGKLRETPMKKVAGKLVSDLSSDWAMVTNSSEIYMTGFAEALEEIDGQCWVSKIFGINNSSLEIIFDWKKVNEFGIEERIAYAKLSTTWCKILGHGQVEPHPFPPYLESFIREMAPKNNDVTGLFNREISINSIMMGHLIFQEAKNAEIKASSLKENSDTTFIDSNAVGNIYFTNYYYLLCKSVEKLISDNFPEYKVSSKEFIHIGTKINHLNEAMPFDHIEVYTTVKKLYEYLVILEFDFFTINSADKTKLKLANAKSHLVYGIGNKRQFRQEKIPKELISNLLGYSANKGHIAARRLEQGIMDKNIEYV